ncbi:hypothetical protein [Pseudomonas sp. 7SR1]|uniref:hypothetical protein n=1 Tax=Pseudomonas sp. 7SR1 TaxID=1881017 RepID=UPI0009536A94|nr:hypothetical protein [Pseudomonas sp. 7SR1]ROO33427.1 hypothetical protein BIV09_23885 [Pseudomonas sp. 7SR1]SIS23081.1 hypothetical protein SAMN05428955_3408 [Pseudomonas sp. 7SR1]
MPAEKKTQRYTFKGAAGEYVYAADFDRVQAENGALQELLNQRDEALHDLEQRRHAEQQACQAAERRVEELAAEVKRLDLMVSQGDYNYDADRAQFKTRIAELSADSQHLRKLLGQALSAVNPTKRLAKDIRAALNPTAEAASHE